MRWILRIVLFPVSIALSVLTAFFSFLLAVGTTILRFLTVLCVIGAIASFIQNDARTGMQALLIGFLISPYGLPAIGVAVIVLMKAVNDKIKEI